MRTEQLMAALRFTSIAGARSGGIDLWERVKPAEFEFGKEACSYKAWKGERIATEDSVHAGPSPFAVIPVADDQNLHRLWDRASRNEGRDRLIHAEKLG